MSIKRTGRPKKATIGKTIRFQKDLVLWLQKQAKHEGLSSDAELVRQIAHEYRQRVEGTAA